MWNTCTNGFPNTAPLSQCAGNEVHEKHGWNDACRQDRSDFGTDCLHFISNRKNHSQENCVTLLDPSIP